MAANTTTLVRSSEFTLAGPVSTTTTVRPASQSLARRVELDARVHQAHVRAHIRRLQSLGRGLPSSTRRPQRRARAIAHTITTAPTTITTTTTTTPHFPVAVPAPRRPLASPILNGLPTPSATPAPAPAPTEEAARPLLPTRRSRDRMARADFHGTSAGLSFGLDLFGEDEPLFTPRAREDGPVRRTPGAPASTNGGGEYFPVPAPAVLERVEDLAM